MDKKYYSSLVIFFIGFFLVKNELCLDRCFGIIEFFFFVIRWLLIIGIIIFLTVRWFLKTERLKYDYLPLIATTIVFAASIIANWTSKHQLNYKDTLTASINKDYDPMRSEILLKENGKYFIELHNIEWMCRYSGAFEIHSDTLYIDKSIISQSDSIFNDKYIFSSDKKYLIPVTKNYLNADTSNWLVVGQKNYP